METVFFLKTYLNDLTRAERLIRSYYDTNQTSKLYICCTKNEFQSLSNNIDCSRITFVDERDMLLRQETGIPGYIQQQLIKLRVCDISDNTNFFILDSDVIFISELSQSDFLDFKGNTYSFVDFDLDVEIMRDWTTRYRPNRQKYLARISDFYEIGAFPSAHGITNLISPYLKEMNAYIEKRGVMLRNLIHEVPLEFSWYFGYCALAGFELKLAPKPIYTFHTAKQYKLLRPALDYDAFKETYFGYVLNSNWADAYDVRSLDDKLSHIKYMKLKVQRKFKEIIR